MLKISAISLVLRTREISDIFNTFDEIYLVFTEKSKYPLFTFAMRNDMLDKLSVAFLIRLSLYVEFCFVNNH